MSSIDEIPIRPDRKRPSPLIESISIWISVIALIVSILAAMDAHRNSERQNELARQNADLQDELARPKLQLFSLRILASSPKPHTYLVLLRVENVGGRTATVLNWSVTPERNRPHVGLLLRTECAASQSDASKRTEISAGDGAMLGVDADFGSSCQLQRNADMRVTIEYSDPDGKSYVQHVNMPSDGPSKF